MTQYETEAILRSPKPQVAGSIPVPPAPGALNLSGLALFVRVRYLRVGEFDPNTDPNQRQLGGGRRQTRMGRHDGMNDTRDAVGKDGGVWGD